MTSTHDSARPCHDRKVVPARPRVWRLRPSEGRKGRYVDVQCVALCLRTRVRGTLRGAEANSVASRAMPRRRAC